jgi:PHD/YefM family antitoxin component YafN of YafNO toxin-antitoxin module
VPAKDAKKKRPPVREFISLDGRTVATTREGAEALVQHFAETFNKHHPGAYELDEEDYPNDEE